MTLVRANESKEIMNKYEELWSRIIDLVRSISNNSDDYDEKYMKIKLNLDDDLPLKKASMIIVVGLFFMKTTNISLKFS